MKLIRAFITFIIILKIVYIYFGLKVVYSRNLNLTGYEFDETWKGRTELIYQVCMSILLLYLFNPFSKKPVVIESEERNLLFLFGALLLFTADWIGVTFTKNAST
jgi:hypothetical protein